MINEQKLLIESAHLPPHHPRWFPFSILMLMLNFFKWQLAKEREGKKRAWKRGVFVGVERKKLGGVFCMGSERLRLLEKILL